MRSTSTSAHPTSLDALTRVTRRLAFAPAQQMLWDRLEQDVSLFLLSRERLDLSEEDVAYLEQCGEKIDMARKCLVGRTRPFSFWDLIHEVDGLLVLVMPWQMLPGRGLEILENFECNVTDTYLRKLWLGEDKDENTGPLSKAVQWLQCANGLASDPPDSGTFDLTLSTCRHTLRGALGVVDYKTNLGFWQLSMNVHIQILSGVLLITLLAGMGSVLLFKSGHLFGISDRIDEWQVLVFTLLGIAGATLANMLSKDPFTIVMGATARWYVYYLFVKPLIGGFAALFLFLVERSALLFEVTKTTGDKALVQIHVTDDTQAFLVRAAFAIVAGVFADRVLSSTMESVLSRMFAKSEKSLGEAHAPAQSAIVKNA